MTEPGRRLYELLDGPVIFGDFNPSTQQDFEYAEEQLIKRERESILFLLEDFRSSCAAYMTKAVWREFDALVVKLGGESKSYVWSNNSEGNE